MLFFRSQFAAFKGNPRPADTYRSHRRKTAGRTWHGIRKMREDESRPIHYSVRTYKAIRSAVKYGWLLARETVAIFRTLLQFEDDRRAFIAARNEKLSITLGREIKGNQYRRFNTVTGGGAPFGSGRTVRRGKRGG